MKKAGIRVLDEWAKGKPLGLVIIAQQLAVGAEPCFEFLKLIKSGDRIEVFSSLPTANEWVKLYRNHRQMQRSVIECLRRFGKSGKFGAEFAEGDVSGAVVQNCQFFSMHSPFLIAIAIAGVPTPNFRAISAMEIPISDVRFELSWFQIFSLACWASHFWALLR